MFVKDCVTLRLLYNSKCVYAQDEKFLIFPQPGSLQYVVNPLMPGDQLNRNRLDF